MEDFAVIPRVYVEDRHIVDLLGARYLRELTFPQIFKDSRFSVTPAIIDRDGEKHVIVGAADAAAHQAAEVSVPFSTYGRYFDWNQGKNDRPKTFAEAVRAVTGNGEIAVEAAMPTGRFQALAEFGPVCVFAMPDERPVHLYAKSRRELEDLWRQTRDADAARLQPFVSGLRFGERLVAAMGTEPVGFEVLDRLAEEAELAGIFISASFDVEMFSGLPQAAADDLGLGAFYRPGRDEIVLISHRPLTRGDFRPLGSAASLAEALRKLADGPVGFQRDHLPVGLFQQIEAQAIGLRDATYVLRRWFDERAGTDLPYFITAANAVLAGIGHAGAFITRHIAAGLTEREVAAAFHQGVQDFAQSVGMDGRVRAYFDIIHPGERTLLPAIAGDYPISTANKTIKFDMGLLVTDSTGCVRGCSDIARSLSPDPALQAVHDRLRALLVDELIPAIKPEMSGAEIHARGVEILRPMTEELKRCGMLHPDMNMDGYTRDCGHTLQRQTLATVHFLPGFAERLHTGMLGCTEFVWPIDDKLIACEDAYYVTEEGAIPFTI
jgi:Xaa-Pro aminopeptidase